MAMVPWRYGQTVLTIIHTCFPRFSPPIAKFTDKISPVCLPQSGDDNRLPKGAHCYATGKHSPLMYYLCY